MASYPSIGSFLKGPWAVFLRGRRSEVSKAIRKEMKDPRKELRRKFASRGVGRALWARGAKERVGRAGAIPFILKTLSARWSRSQNAWVTGFHAKGMAAIIEQGGTLTTGARVRRHNYIGPTLHGATPGVVQSVNAALKKYIRAVGLG